MDLANQDRRSEVWPWSQVSPQLNARRLASAAAAGRHALLFVVRRATSSPAHTFCPSFVLFFPFLPLIVCVHPHEHILTSSPP
jgi:hypothetical protein